MSGLSDRTRKWRRGWHYFAALALTVVRDHVKPSKALVLSPVLLPLG